MALLLLAAPANAQLGGSGLGNLNSPVAGMLGFGIWAPVFGPQAPSPDWQPPPAPEISAERRAELLAAYERDMRVVNWVFGGFLVVLGLLAAGIVALAVIL